MMVQVMVKEWSSTSVVIYEQVAFPAHSRIESYLSTMSITQTVAMHHLRRRDLRTERRTFLRVTR